MGIDNKKEKNIAKVIYIGVVIIVSAILTVFSMEAIKNVPGNGFSTEMELIATALLVFVLWFLAIMSCIWLARFLTNLNKAKKSPSGAEALIIAEKKDKDIKNLTTLRKIIAGTINVACIYLLILFSVGACIFTGLGVPTGVWIVFILANVCIVLSLLACAVSNLVTMTKLKRNPHDEKAIKTKEKEKKLSKVLIILYACLYVLTTVCLLILRH